MDYEIVPALAEHIERRMTELRLDPNGLAEATGLSLTVLQQLRKGYRKKYQRRLTWPVCETLGWTADSIERILRGEEPVLTVTPRGESYATRKWVTEQLALLGGEIQLLRSEVAELVQLQGHEAPQPPPASKESPQRSQTSPRRPL